MGHIEDTVEWLNMSVPPSISAGADSAGILAGAQLQGIIDDCLSRFVTVTSELDEFLQSDEETRSVIRVSPDNKGLSRKPSNVYLNWRKLTYETVPELGLGGIGGVTVPVWALPLVALYMWRETLQAFTEPLDAEQATVIAALWKASNAQNRVPVDEGRAVTNVFRTAHELDELTATEFDLAIDRLEALRCLEVDAGDYLLRERVLIGS